MIRFRDINGTTAEVQEQFRFVEVCDLSGRIAMLLYRDDAGMVKTVEAGSPMADRYKNMFKGHKVEFCPIIRLT